VRMLFQPLLTSMGAVYEVLSIRLHVIPFVGWMVGVALMVASHSTRRSIQGGESE